MIDSGDPLIGHRVGHIRIVERLGAGGMGSVYVGQDETLGRRVAVKVIHAEHRLSEELRARFLREARILSQLDHPGICAVHDYVDGGDTDFLVLELVHGRTLREILREGLPRTKTLDVAEQVLEVLAAVHAEGVIHRDLKADNVMLSADGRIKVLDFGLARSVDAAPAEGSCLPTQEFGASGDAEAPTLAPDDAGGSSPGETRLGAILGTAGWMSPEQARGEPATAASDIFSLALLLQHLLTGSSPVDKGSTPLQLVERAARGESMPVQGLDAELTGLIEDMKQADPALRPTARDALSRLRVYRDKPRRRRLRRLVTTVGVALVLLSVAATIQSIRASRAARTAEVMRAQAAAAAERAEREADIARRVSDYLVDMFSVLKPSATGGRTLTAEEVLDLGVEGLQGEMENHPLVLARLRYALAEIYLEMGKLSKARPLFDSAYAIRKDRLGEHDPELAESIASEGFLRYSDGDHEGAEALYRRALAMQETSLGPDAPEVGSTLVALLSLLYQRGQVDEALTMAQRMVKIYEADLKDGGKEAMEGYALALNSMGVLEMDRGNHEEGESWLRRALSFTDENFSPEHPLRTKTLSNLAGLLTSVERYGDAEPIAREAWQLSVQVYGEDHFSSAHSARALARCLVRLERFEEAEPLALSSMETLEEMVGADNVYSAGALAVYADVLHGLGRDGEADLAFRRSVRSMERAVGGESGKPLIGTYRRYAAFLRDVGRAEEAAELEARADEAGADLEPVAPSAR